MPEAPKPVSADAMSIGGIYYLLFRYKWTIGVCSLLGLLASLVVLMVTPGVYESEAALMVRYVSDTTVLDTVATGERITAPGRGGENVINSEIAILSSRELVEKVIDEMGPNRFSLVSTNAPDRARLAQSVMSAIKIEAPKNSNIIRIAFDGSEPAVAQEFLRRLTDAYLQKHIEIHRASGAYEFLSKQTDQLRSRLSETEEELRKLKYAEGIVSVEETKKLGAQRTEELTKELDELETAMAAAKARMDVLRPLLTPSGGSRTSTVFAAAGGLETAPALRARLSHLRQKEAELRALYTGESIPVQSVRDQIAETQRLLSGGMATGATNDASPSGSTGDFVPALLEDQVNMAALQAKIDFRRGLLDRTLAKAKKNDSVEARIVQLERSKELQEANYKYFCQSLEHARVDEALTSGRISNIGVVQPATLPVGKLRPKLAKNMGLALLLGIACGLGLALLKEHFIDHTIRRPAELSAILKAPLVLSLPDLSADRSPPKAGRGWNVTRLLNPHGGRPDGKGREAPDEQAEWRDLYDALRDRLLTVIGSGSSKVPFILGVTSCAHGSGVTSITAGLALALARNGDARVVLMDAGAESAIPTMLGVNPTTGIVEMIPDGEGNTVAMEHNLYVVPSGEAGSKSSQASRADRLAAMIRQLRNSQAGFVLVDMPPVTETGLTRRLGRLLDGVLLVIAAEKVDRHVAEHARDWLLQSETRIVGSILNKRRQYVPSWLYPTC